MSKVPKVSPLRTVVFILLMGAVLMLGSSAWLMATDGGAPVFLPVGGGLLALLASLLASKLRKA